MAETTHQQVQARIDWRRTPEDEEFVQGVPEQMSAEYKESILDLNRAIGWEKYRVEEVEEIEGEESG